MDVKDEKIVVVYSGGLDSTTLLQKAMYDGFSPHCINFQYGSKHNASEGKAAKQICKVLMVPLTVVDLDFVANHFKSDLLKTGGDIPEGHYAADNMKSTVVPFRNGIMLSIAIGFAESIGATKVALASHRGDHYVYPDCRPVFTHAMAIAAESGTEKGVQLWAPFQNMTKTQIVKLGQRLDDIDQTILSMSWSCYKGGEKHCGKCGTCVERIEAFKDNGFTDYAEYDEGVVSWE